MKNISKFITESVIDDILDDVRDWFWSNCGEDGYDSPRERREDLEAMADENNDIMVDTCISEISISSSDEKKYYNDICKTLAELAAEELENL